MTLEGIIFDWDGVVVNSSDLHEKSWLALASELDLPLPAVSYTHLRAHETP